MKKILSILIFSILAFSLNISFLKAQNNNLEIVRSLTVAYVGIYNATNTKINSDTYDISFSLENEQGIQPDVRYGIVLEEKNTGEIVDMQLSNDSIVLKEKDSKNINIKYRVPSFIPDGIYKISIVAQNAAGIPLGKSPIGFPEKYITISKNTSSVSLNSCYLYVGNDSSGAKYTISQGVDIMSNEELFATCKISNSSMSLKSNLSLQLITHIRDQFGDIVAKDIALQNISVKGKGEQEITFKIPNQTKPQSYDIDTFLINGKGEKASMSTYLHYVIAGNSATIQNSILDKTSYKKGENATLDLFWSSSADSFPMSRLGGTKNTYKVSAKILNSTNSICGEASKTLSPSNDLNDMKIIVPIVEDCEGAIANVEILDKEGNVLSESEINSNSKGEVVNINPNIPQEKVLAINNLYIFLFVIVLVLIGYGILVFRKENK